MVTILRQESQSLKLDQSSKLDTISSTLNELKSTTEDMVRERPYNNYGFTGSSKKEASLAENEGAFKQNRSSFEMLPVDTLSTEISKLALTEQGIEEVAREQAVLKSLNFPSRPGRHDNIPFAHAETFRWMIDSPQGSEDEAQHRFPEWLRNGEEIFWVSGKPGSGKSTLMKFLADHETTREILEEWATPMKLVIASHYFWSAGTLMQKSHEGLFRTLLYDIFRMCPASIRQACPIRWRQTNPARTEDNNDWTVFELTRTLQALARQADLPVRYCFFIDGIDEFDGDHFKLCEMLRDLSQSANIKLCLASRPWNVFLDAFGNDPLRKICVENLTRNDILQYTKSRLMEHRRWNLSRFQAKEKQSIIDDITSKAQGVFLWVFLVTKSLQDGLTNGDTMLDLHNRLEDLPTDLERFFKHMLETVERVYHEKMASFLSIAVSAKQPLGFLLYSMHEHEYEDEDYALKLPVFAMSQEQMWTLQDECQRRVNARCGGLLEIKNDSVEFLHRTVRDFLFSREMSDYLGTKTRPGFSASLSTLRAYVATLKQSQPATRTFHNSSSVEKSLLAECLQCSNDAIEDLADPTTELLNVLEDLYMEVGEGDGSVLGWTLVNESGVDSSHGVSNFDNTCLDFYF